jgi:hypothetical protein
MPAFIGEKCEGVLEDGTREELLHVIGSRLVLVEAGEVKETSLRVRKSSESERGMDIH